MTLLCDTKARVYHLDEAENEHRLALLGEQTYHLHLLTRIPSVTVEDSERVVGLLGDGACYLDTCARKS